MSASACVAFYGLRFEIDSSGIDALESRTDPRMLAARKGGLEHYWGNFDAPAERFLLLVGRRLGVLGPENASEIVLSSEEIVEMMRKTEQALKSAGLSGDPSLFLQWERDM